MAMKKSFLLAAPVVTVVAVLAWVNWSSSPVLNSATKTDGALPSQVSAANDSKMQQPQAAPAPHISSAPSEAAVVVAYAQSTDLGDFVVRNEAKARAGDAQAARYISKAFETCASYGSKPAEAVATLREILKPKMSEQQIQRFDQASARQVERCRSIASLSRSGSEMSDWMEIARNNGDTYAALARSMESHDKEGVHKQLDAIRNARDGEAMLDMGRLLVNLSVERRQELGDALAEPESGYAWQLAACRLGADCSANGPEASRLCYQTGFCYGSVEEAMTALIPPAQLPAVRDLEQKILKSFDGK